MCSLFASECLYDLRSVIGIHQVGHIIDATHVDPAGCIIVHDRENV